jgi:hypothetical protein
MKRGARDPEHIRGGCQLLSCSATTFYRATLWEIHPVTRIQVRQGNAWVDLKDIDL